MYAFYKCINSALALVVLMMLLLLLLLLLLALANLAARIIAYILKQKLSMCEYVYAFDFCDGEEYRQKENYRYIEHI